MMAALAAGGLPLICDQQRQADTHNPRGYFEDSRVLALNRDAGWLHGREGHGIKILSHLLRQIPCTVKARILFMRRPLSQVLASQNAMLGQESTPGDLADLIQRDLAQTLSWLEQQPHLQVLQVGYLKLLDNPRTEFARVLDFLRLELDLPAMVATVDRALHRQKG
jgi:hypothetical protein